MTRISKRLLIYFLVALITLSLLLGGIFSAVFSNYTKKLQERDLLLRAENISQSLGELISTSSRGGSHMGGQMGLGSYLNFIDDIAQGDVWLIGIESHRITRSHHARELSLKELPQKVEEIIGEVLEGKSLVSESFSGFLSKPMLSVGVPIRDSSQVLGGVFLHRAVEGLKEARSTQLRLMVFSIVMAFLLSVPMALSFSRRFTSPLERLRTTAQGLAQGDYGLRSQVSQEDEIGELARDIDILAERLEQVREQEKKQEEDRRAFLSNISHELRTPVTVIRSSLEALKDGIIQEEEKKEDYYEQMLTESIQLERLINDLLELSLLRSTEFSLEEDQLNLSELVQGCIRSMEVLAKKKSLVLVHQKDEDFNMRGDYGRLRQMLNIVLDNALRFAPENSELRVKEILEEGYFRLSVIDRGPGFSQLPQDFSFTDFSRRSRKDPQAGAGLGLSIAMEIARAQGFEIEITSRPGLTEVSFVYRLDYH